MEHDVKIDLNRYKRISTGAQTFIVLDNIDREFQQGDLLTLREWDKNPINATAKGPKGFTDSEPLKFKCGFVQVLGSNVVISLIAAPQNAKKKGKS